MAGKFNYYPLHEGHGKISAMKRHALSLLLWLGASICCNAQTAPSLAVYAGQYVMRLGQRNLIVMNLRLQGATLEGSLKRPRGFGGNTRITVTNPAIATYNVRAALLVGDHLKLTVVNAEKTSDVDTWNLHLVDPSHATLGSEEVDFAIEPFPLLRVSAQSQESVSTDWDPNHAYGPDDGMPSSPVMASIFAEDQKPRQNNQLSKAQWADIGKADEARREQVRALLKAGSLHTGEDFEKAAFIFQHGSNPEDYLLAHTLAMVAVVHGSQGAIWIASATLDRYLQSIGRPQIYGTQFLHKPGTAWTQDPYDRDLISDALRRPLDVPSQPVQEKQLEIYKKQTAP